MKKQEREKVYEKCDRYCAYCGYEIEFSEFEADHIIPLHLGGDDDITNMLPVCRSCNHYKHTLTVEKFWELLKELHERMIQNNANYRLLLRYGIIKKEKETIYLFWEKSDKMSEQRLIDTTYQDKILKWWLETNTENGVVYIPDFEIKKILEQLIIDPETLPIVKELREKLSWYE